MWILWLILVAPSAPGEHPVHRDGVSLEVCTAEKIRMTKEFQQSYPGDTDYRFECRFVRGST